MTEIIEGPVCIKCQARAMCLVHGCWVCGPCLKDWNDKNNQRYKEMFITG